MGYLHPLLPEDPRRIGVYILVGRLDQDPEHSAYLGHLPDDDTIRVIRLLAAEPGAPDPRTRERITNELHAAKRASGAHAARLLEVGWFDDHPYVVREHIEGPTLRQAVAANGPLTGEALERFTAGTLTALTALHLSGLAHGSLTPDTVLLGPDGPRVFDIGLEPVTGEREPDYRAPERIREEATSAPEAGKPADLFAWAATVVYAATGRAPFGGIAEKVLEGSADLTGLPAELRPLLASCLDGRALERPDAKTAMLRLLGEPEAPETAPLPGVVTGPAIPPSPGVVSGVSGTASDAGTEIGTPSVGGQARPGTGNTGNTGNTGKNDASRGERVPGAAVPRQVEPATSVWGAPQLPQAASAAPGSPDPAPAKAVRDRPRTGNFSMALAACVGVIVLLSGLGIWAAGRYTALSEQRASADGAIPEVSLGLVDRSRNEPQGQDPVRNTGENPTGKVTVPWGTTPEPEVGEVRPLQLPSDVPTELPQVPDIGMYTNPPPVPTAPLTEAPNVPGVPTATAGGPSESSAPAARPTPTPTPTPTLTVEPEGAPSGTPTPGPEGAPTPTPTPGPEGAPSGTPTPTPAPAGTPTPTRPAAKPTSSQALPSWRPPHTARPSWTSRPSWTFSPSRPSSSAPVRRANPYTPEKVCGPGFLVQRRSPFTGGTVYLLFNAATKNTCVVTLKNENVGVASPLWATLEVQGSPAKTARGSHGYYVGPVLASAQGKCVRFSGGGSAGSTAPLDGGTCW